MRPYIGRVIANMTNEEIGQMESALPTYAFIIKKKILSLIDVYREQRFNPICVWSTGSEHPMTDEQLAARQYILENECVPPQYDLFIFNDSCATSINLFGEMDYIVLHTTDSTRMIQARGRYRGDIDVLYCYDRDEEEVIVPDEFLEVELYSEGKQELRTVLDIKQKSGKPLPYKQMFWLLESYGYRLEFGRRNNRHYFIIRKL